MVPSYKQRMLHGVADLPDTGVVTVFVSVGMDQRLIDAISMTAKLNAA